MVDRCARFLAAVTASFGIAAAAQAAPAVKTDCGKGLWCSSVEVPEDWSKPDGHKLRLRIVAVKARKPVAGAEPIFFMAGGPGQTATEFAQYAMDGPETEHRDMIFMDERGTERGNGLHCPIKPGADMFRTPYNAENALACLAHLKSKMDLSHYTTADSIRDFDAARAALGYDKINLEGVSGGTYTGLMYARAFPERVRTMILISAVTPNILLPLFHARNAQESLDRLFGECAADTSCNARYPNLKSEYYALLDELEKNPRTLTLHGKDGKPDSTVVVTRDVLADATRVLMYGGGSDLPKLITQGRAGRLEPFASTMLKINQGFYDRANLGMELNVTCAEFLPFVSAAMIAKETAGTYLGDRRVAGQKAACAHWPTATLPAGWFAPFTANVPTLIFSGRRDPVTPPRWGEEMRRWLPNSAHIIVPGGHSPFLPCMGKPITKFLETASTAGLSADCRKDEARWE